MGGNRCDRSLCLALAATRLERRGHGMIDLDELDAYLSSGQVPAQQHVAV